MEIIKAEHLGFCNGVKRAIYVAKAHAPCLTYKELIHNKKVVDGLKNEGIYPVHDLSVVQSGDNVVIAAHGAAPSDFEKLARMSKWDKLLMRISNLSKDIRFDELRKVMESYGYKMNAPRSGSSHYTFRKPGCQPITIPRHEPIKKVYVEMVKEIVESEAMNNENA